MVAVVLSDASLVPGKKKLSTSDRQPVRVECWLAYIYSMGIMVLEVSPRS